MSNFIGREQELESLENLIKRKKTTVAVIKGRRRIGKSRLVEEFAKNKIFFNFSGLPPVDLDSKDQKRNFAYQLSRQVGLPPFTFEDWSDAFHHLTHHITNSPTVILFDEISWIGDKDPTFVPKLKNWFDLELQDKENLVIIFCGSVSMWIEDNIINSTAFFGRVALTIDLEPFSIAESCKFLKNQGFKGSNYEILQILSVTGGVPWYLEQISNDKMTDENIKELCFQKGGLLTLEYDKIFNDLFGPSGTTYKKILHALSDGVKNLAEIREAINYPNSGTVSQMMKNLIISGFVTQHYQWSIKKKSLTKQSLYRLSDCYIRFYIKYIEKNLTKIEQNTYKDVELSSLPNWQGIMGFQLESLLLQNHLALLKAIGIAPESVAMDNPYIQKHNSKQKGCQIDYLVQTQTQNLFVCEFKFNTRELGLEVVEQIKEKINRLKIPRGFGVVPVLFHFGGVTISVYEQNYFYKIIDINSLLEMDKNFI